MKRLLKKFISIFSAMIIVFSVVVIPVSAAYDNNILECAGAENYTSEAIETVMNFTESGYGFTDEQLEIINSKKYFMKVVIPISSDVVISKPGGLSTTEIAAIRKPLIHMFAIPGIEEYNEKFFEERGMSRVCNIDNIKESVIKCFDDNKFINNQKKYIYSDSAYKLVKFVIDNYH